MDKATAEIVKEAAAGSAPRFVHICFNLYLKKSLTGEEYNDLMDKLKNRQKRPVSDVIDGKLQSAGEGLKSYEMAKSTATIEPTVDVVDYFSGK